MLPAERRERDTSVDVCLVLEGTYPYVKGGVSTWVHELIGRLPELRFSLVHVSPERGTYTRKHYDPPANVVGLTDLYCRESPARDRDLGARQRAAQALRHRHADARRRSRVLSGIRRLHLDDRADESLLEDLASGDLSPEAFLHGRASFELTMELYERLAPEASLLDFFWHFRSMHLPLVRLLAADAPQTGEFHALCTGYAGLLAAIWSLRERRPFLLTEHGIYARERRLELDRAAWLNGARDGRHANGTDGAMDGGTASALRRIWVGFFRALARCAYARASVVVSLCESSRERQIADGALPERTRVIPNGIDLERFHARVPSTPVPARGHGRLRVGFVGRIVPIKNVVAFIRACAIALREVELEVSLFGPADEDPAYALRCRQLAKTLGIEDALRFESTRPIERIYPALDVLVLTSFSEGQPLVILEAGAAGIPVVATDVGACREMLEGRAGEDRARGPSGIVTPLAAPEATAEAIVRLARDPELRRRMGAAARARVAACYRHDATVEAYRSLYALEPWPESAGVSSV